MSIVDVLFLTLKECFYFLLQTLVFYDSKYGVVFSIPSIMLGGLTIGCLMLVISVLFSLKSHNSADVDKHKDKIKDKE